MAGRLALGCAQLRRYARLDQLHIVRPPGRGMLPVTTCHRPRTMRDDDQRNNPPADPGSQHRPTSRVPLIGRSVMFQVPEDM
jgi:hypothetical protein